MKPVYAAQVAANAVGEIRHAAVWGGYAWPADVDAVLVALTELAQYLPQAIGQTAIWLSREHAAGRLAHDTPGADVAGCVFEALSELDVAAQHAEELAGALDRARQHTAHLRSGVS